MPHVAWAKGTTVIWVDSIYGWRSAIREQERLLNELGHKVYAPDLYLEPGKKKGDRVFNKLGDAQKYAARLGVFNKDGELEESLEKNIPLRRLAEFTKDAGPAVWAGWSVGALLAQRMAWERAKDPKHRPIGLLLMGQVLEEKYYPTPRVPVVIHAAQPDRFVHPDDLKLLEQRGATVHRYTAAQYPPRVGHIFADRRLPDYNGAATAVWWKSVTEVLDGFASLQPMAVDSKADEVPTK
jgi:dienelactone hydrolase